MVDSHLSQQLGVAGRLQKKGVPALIILFSFFLLTPYFLVPPGQFIYDDIHHLRSHPYFLKLTSLLDCLNFSIKPARKLSDFSIAIASYLLGPFAWPQRLLSLVLHYFTAVMLYINLRQLFNRAPFFTNNQLTAGSLLAACFFLSLPIHTETIVVAQFRCEILGSLFSLIACALSQILAQIDRAQFAEKNFSWKYFPILLLLFLSLGFAALSKETFLLIAPFSSIAFYTVTLLRNKMEIKKAGYHFWVIIALSCFFWGDFIFRANSQTTFNKFDYEGAVGWQVTSLHQHIDLWIRATYEGVWKSFTGLNLSSVRMAQRTPWLSSMLAYLLVGVGLFIGIYLAWKRRKKEEWLIFFGVLSIVGLLPYLLIPNINLGSEHYWYFSELWIAGFFGFFIVRLYSDRKKRIGFLILFCVSYILFLQNNLLSRLFDAYNRLSFTEAELMNNPESVQAWTNFLSAQIEDNTNAPLTTFYLLQMKKRFPTELETRLIESSYHLITTKNLELLNESLLNLAALVPQASSSSLAMISNNYYFSSELFLSKNFCEMAEALFLVAIRLNPTDPHLNRIAPHRSLEQLQQRYKCRTWVPLRTPHTH